MVKDAHGGGRGVTGLDSVSYQLWPISVHCTVLFTVINFQNQEWMYDRVILFLYDVAKTKTSCSVRSFCANMWISRTINKYGILHHGSADGRPSADDGDGRPRRNLNAADAAGCRLTSNSVRGRRSSEKERNKQSHSPRSVLGWCELDVKRFSTLSR